MVFHGRLVLLERDRKITFRSGAASNFCICPVLPVRICTFRASFLLGRSGVALPGPTCVLRFLDRALSAVWARCAWVLEIEGGPACCGVSGTSSSSCILLSEKMAFQRRCGRNDCFTLGEERAHYFCKVVKVHAGLVHAFELTLRRVSFHISVSDSHGSHLPIEVERCLLENRFEHSCLRSWFSCIWTGTSRDLEGWGDGVSFERSLACI
jgi:hypothetical protein